MKKQLLFGLLLLTHLSFGQDWSISIGQKLGLSNTLILNNSSYSSKSIQQLNKQQKPHVFHSSEVLIQLPINNKWSLKSGIGISQFATKQKYGFAAMEDGGTSIIGYQTKEFERFLNLTIPTLFTFEFIPKWHLSIGANHHLLISNSTKAKTFYDSGKWISTKVNKERYGGKIYNFAPHIALDYTITDLKRMNFNIGLFGQFAQMDVKNHPFLIHKNYACGINFQLVLKSKALLKNDSLVK